MKHRWILMITAVMLGVLVGCSTPPPLGDTPDDARIAENVMLRLGSDNVTNRSSFQARCEEGVVTLYGDVKNPHIKATALAIARGTPGVLRVVDYITN